MQKGLPKMFQGYQRAKGFRVSRDRGFSPCWLGLSKSLAFPKSKGFRDPGCQKAKGFRVQGLEDLPLLAEAFKKF